MNKPIAGHVAVNPLARRTLDAYSPVRRSILGALCSLFVLAYLFVLALLSSSLEAAEDPGPTSLQILVNGLTLEPNSGFVHEAPLDLPFHVGAAINGHAPMAELSNAPPFEPPLAVDYLDPDRYLEDTKAYLDAFREENTDADWAYAYLELYLELAASEYGISFVEQEGDGQVTHFDGGGGNEWASFMCTVPGSLTLSLIARVPHFDASGNLSVQEVPVSVDVLCGGISEGGFLPTETVMSSLGSSVGFLGGIEIPVLKIFWWYYADQPDPAMGEIVRTKLGVSEDMHARSIIDFDGWIATPCFPGDSCTGSGHSFDWQVSDQPMPFELIAVYKGQKITIEKFDVVLPSHVAYTTVGKLAFPPGMVGAGALAEVTVFPSDVNFGNNTLQESSSGVTGRSGNFIGARVNGHPRGQRIEIDGTTGKLKGRDLILVSYTLPISHWTSPVSTWHWDIPLIIEPIRPSRGYLLPFKVTHFTRVWGAGGPYPPGTVEIEKDLVQVIRSPN